MSFRREKYVPAGGPDGGDGGRGGDVVIEADATDTSLGAFRERKRFAAQNGQPGSAAKRSGRDGETLVLHVPPGTVVRDGGELLADLDRFGARVIATRGGRGGRGNARFTTSTRQAPRIGEVGAPGERRRLILELKLIADIGLVGLPNAGKSTLLAALTGAHPKIADYAFTTLHPNLGVAELHSGSTLVLADVPGLIEGAHQGAGLGHDFLRHLERTRVLVHVIDASLGVEAALDARQTVERELHSFSDALARRPAVIAFNKMDVTEAAAVEAELRVRVPDAFFISAAAGHGVRELLERAAAVAASAAPVAPDPPSGVHRLYRHQSSRAAVQVTLADGVYRVASPDVERMVMMTDLDSDEAVLQLQRRLRARGVDSALAAAGCSDGDDVVIGDFEFTYVDDR